MDALLIEVRQRFDCSDAISRTRKRIDDQFKQFSGNGLIRLGGYIMTRTGDIFRSTVYSGTKRVVEQLQDDRHCRWRAIVALTLHAHGVLASSDRDNWR